MGDIGIGIRVGYTEVTAGKKALDGLKQSLEEVKDNSDFSFGSDGNSMEGATKGARQFRKELEGASSATAKIVKDYDKLIKIATSTATKNLSDGAGRVSIGHGKASDYDAALRRAAERSTGIKRKTYGEQYLEQHGNMGRTTRDGVDESGGGSGGPGLISSMAGKVGMIAAGAVTIGSAIAFLHAARNKYEEGAVNETRLNGRGVTRPGAYMGFTRTEMQGHASDLHSQSGYTANNSIDATMRFAAGTGTDPSLGIGIMASSRDLTGGGSKTGEKMLGVLQAISKSTHDSPERINRLLSGSYGLFSKAQGGAELAGTQLANIQALTEALHKTGTQGRDSGTMGVMKGAFKSTGDAATDILKNKMMGLYDGPMSFDKVWQIKKREEEGLTNKENRVEFLKLMKDPTMQRGQKLTLASHFFKGMDTRGVETFVDATLGTLDEEGLARQAGQYGSWNGIDTSGYKGSGVAIRNRKVKREENQHGFGGPVSEAMGAWEDKIYAGMGKVLEAGLPQKIVDAIFKIGNTNSGKALSAAFEESPIKTMLSPGLMMLQKLSEGKIHGDESRVSNTWKHDENGTGITSAIGNLFSTYIGPLVEEMRKLNTNLAGVNNGGSPTAVAPAPK